MTVQSALLMQPNTSAARSCGCSPAPAVAAAPATSAPTQPPAASRPAQHAACPTTPEPATLNHLAPARPATAHPCATTAPVISPREAHIAIQIMRAAISEADISNLTLPAMTAPKGDSSDTTQLVRNILRAVVGTAGEGRQTQLASLAAPLRAPDDSQLPDDGRDIRALVGWAPIAGPASGTPSHSTGTGATDGRSEASTWRRTMARAAFLAAMVLVPVLVTLVILVVTGR